MSIPQGLPKLALVIFNSQPFSKSSRFFFALAAGAALFGAFLVDDFVTDAIRIHSSPHLDRLAYWLGKIGDWPPLLAAGLLIVLAAVRRRRFEAGRLVLLVVLAGMLSGLSATVIRSFTGRTRPGAPAPQGFYGPRREGRWVVGKAAFNSFPSGHTATVAGLTVAAWMVRRRAGLSIGVFALLVAWSRVAGGHHHFSDVVAAGCWACLAAPWGVIRLDPFLKRLWVNTPWLGGCRPG